MVITILNSFKIHNVLHAIIFILNILKCCSLLQFVLKKLNMVIFHFYVFVAMATGPNSIPFRFSCIFIHQNTKYEENRKLCVATKFWYLHRTDLKNKNNGSPVSCKQTSILIQIFVTISTFIIFNIVQYKNKTLNTCIQ